MTPIETDKLIGDLKKAQVARLEAMPKTTAEKLQEIGDQLQELLRQMEITSRELRNLRRPA